MIDLSRTLRFSSALIATILVLSLLPLVAPPASADTFNEPRIALMVRPHEAKSPVDPDAGNIPYTEFVTRGEVGATYDVYLVVVGGDSDRGLAGLSCGIHYDGEPGRGIDVMRWTSFADLEFPNGIDPEDEAYDWPVAGGGNRILWDRLRNCQTRVASDGNLHAVAGSFYVTAYGPDTFWITPNRNLVSGPELQTLYCDIEITDIPESSAGLAVFSSDPTQPGCNPCIEPCPEAPPGPPRRIPICEVDPVTVIFGNVPLNETRAETVTVRNDGYKVLTGEIKVYKSSAFSGVHSGEHVYLEPGESFTRVITFSPVETGSNYCHVTFADGCPVFRASGYGGTPPPPLCLLIPPGPVDLDTVAVGQVAYKSFRIMNRGGGTLVGSILTDCPDFSIAAGKGGYTLGHWAVRTAVIRFAPSAPGDYECTIPLCEYCDHITFRGVAVPDDNADPGEDTFGGGSGGEDGGGEGSGTPVRLASFEVAATAEGVRLDWVTEMETDHAGFHVLRAGAGEETYVTSEPIVSGPKYGFLDDTGSPGALYDYWLEAVARDGSRERFGPRTIVYPEPGPFLRIFPNPARAGQLVHFDVPAGADVEADLFDLAGRHLRGWRGAGELDTGWDGRLANGTPAAPGVYFLRVRNGKDTRSLRLVLIR